MTVEVNGQMGRILVLEQMMGYAMRDMVYVRIGDHPSQRSAMQRGACDTATPGWKTVNEDGTANLERVCGRVDIAKAW